MDVSVERVGPTMFRVVITPERADAEEQAADAERALSEGGRLRPTLIEHLRKTCEMAPHVIVERRPYGGRADVCTGPA